MRKRRAFISFPEQHGSDSSLLTSQKVLDGLNIGFHVRIVSDMGVPAEANIDIYNLNRDDLQFLTTSAANWMAKKTLIQLYAGYDDDVEMIFGGQIMTAPPEGYPDLALHIKCLSGLEWMTQHIDVQKANIKLGDLIDYTSSVTGFPVNIPAKLRRSNEFLNKKIDEFSYSGSVYNLLDKIQNMLGGFSIGGKSLFLSTYNDNTFVWNPEGESEGQTLYISKESGMVGVPAITDIGVNIKMLLNTKIRTGNIIYLHSDRVPDANGRYYVTEITHDGELRGTSWYTTLRCTRIGGLIGEATNGKAI